MKDNTVYLKHIMDAIIQIQNYVGDRSLEEFLENQMLQDAVVHRPRRTMTGEGCLPQTKADKNWTRADTLTSFSAMPTWHGRDKSVNSQVENSQRTTRLQWSCIYPHVSVVNSQLVRAVSAQ